MVEFFRDILDYNYLTNQKLSDAFIDNSNKVSDKSIKLYSHILNAHQIWNYRIHPNQTAFGVWQIHPIENFANINKANHEHSLLILNEHGLNKIITYSNTEGQSFSNSIQDIIFHSINHSTYHRAQIATEFSQNGLSALNTDYIYFKRQSTIQ